MAHAALGAGRRPPARVADRRSAASAMLGCVYYPWSALHHIRWLQIAVLFNPMVYMSEGFRAVLTPGVGHLAMWAILLVLIGGAALIGYLGTRTFTRRVLN